MSEEHEDEQWWWCLHCERVNHGKRPDQCPHGDCDGDWLDMWLWDQIRDGEGFGDYPLTPDTSMVYPMYADTHGSTRTAYPATGGGSVTATQTGGGNGAAPDTDEGCPPFLAVGSDELGDPIGEMVDCARCGATHPVEYGERRLPDGTMEPSRTLAFCRCEGVTYLVGIDGRAWSAGGAV